MKKFERQVFLAIESTGAKVISRKKIGGHARLLVRLPNGDERKVVVSSSPTIPEHAILAVKRDVLRFINPPTGASHAYLQNHLQDQHDPA